VNAQTPYWCWACWSPLRECSCSPVELREYEMNYRKTRDRRFPNRGLSLMLAAPPSIRITTRADVI
jgi:hypothetical protein